MKHIRNDWTLDQISEVYKKPLLSLIFEASVKHAEYHNLGDVKVSRLISVKTGHCVENCSYCAQSSLYNTGVAAHKMLSVEEVKALAEKALADGIKRVCLSASWKKIPDGDEFEKVLNLIGETKKMGLDVCLTMGKITEQQAVEISKAGITAYNHNIDTSENYYDKVVTSRTFADRIETLNTLIDNNIQPCSGGILGMGESEEDRISMLHALATLKQHPYTVPLNILVPVEGTPFENKCKIDDLEMVRMIAATRIVMPQTNISLAAGRREMSEEAQALCFLAGANSVFLGEKLLTTQNSSPERDLKMFDKFGLNLI